jgi:hypothetical protein
MQPAGANKPGGLFLLVAGNLKSHRLRAPS